MAEKTETIRLLIVSRELALLRPLWSIGESNSWHLETASSGWEAMERVQSEVAPDLLLLDLSRGEGDSLHILRWLRRLRPELPVVVTCHPEDAGKKNEAIRLGAEEVLLRPFDEEALEAVIRRHLGAGAEDREVEIASDDIESVGEDEFFLSASPVMQKLRAQAELLAQADVPVLILGEQGSGKVTVARLIHKLSVRSGFQFLRVNCAAMPGEMLETELFGKFAPRNGSGHVNQGKLQLGEKGTLLLEEITEMPVSVQSRLLQAMQEKQFARAEDGRPVEVGVRILAASSANLSQSLEEKKLREDLYYRLSAFTIHVPPLRRRKEEIRVLLRYSMHKLARYYGLPAREFTAPVLDACVNHSWPGNLRELENFVKRYLVAGDKDLHFGQPTLDSALEGDRAADAHSQGVPVDLARSTETAGAEPPTSLKSLIQSVKSEAEKNAIAAALEKTGWNRKAAARMLRVSYRTLLYKIDQYRMNASEHYATGFPYAGPSGKDFKRNGKAS